MSDQDEYQSIPVAEARAAVQASGLLEAIEGPQYLAHDEAEWKSYFTPAMAAVGHPLLARVIVTRSGQKPREVVISWEEYAAELELDDPAWAEKRKQKPMTIFGAEVERHAYRVVFADVLAKLERPRESPNALTDGQLQSLRDQLSAPARDWHADLAATSTKQEVEALFEEARVEKALTDPSLHEAFTRRLRDVLKSPVTAEVAPVEDAWTPGETVGPAASFSVPIAPSPIAVAAKAKPLTVQAPRRPQGDRPQGQRRRGKR